MDNKASFINTQAKEFNASSSSIRFENVEKEVDDLIDAILRIYPYGINSIIEECEKETNCVALILVLHGTSEFVKAYITRAQRKVSEYETNPNEGTALREGSLTPSTVSNSFQDTESKVLKRIRETKRISTVLLEIFSELNSSNERLVERLISQYVATKGRKIKQSSDYYLWCKRLMSLYDIQIPNYLDDQYYELEFEDFVLIFCSILRYYTGINIKLELRNIQSHKVMLKCFCSENNYNLLAEFFGYELQLKPYAYKYNEYQLKKLFNIDVSRSIRSVSSRTAQHQSPALATNVPELKFEALNHSNCLLFPPYMTYERSKGIKFRRYSPNDDYHECRVDPEFYPDIKEQCKECSIYRSIDKLRLLYKAITHIMPLSLLYKHRLISMIIYQKNYRAYDKKLKTFTIFADTLRICCSQSYMKTLNTIRNYFGENISFYFLWVSFFFTWMLFPAFLGIIGSVIMVDPQNFLYEGKIDTFKNFRLDFYDISIIAFGLIITIWATLFLKAFLHYQSLFRYFWGMEHYEKNEPQSEFFVPDRTIPFIIGESLKTVTSWKTQLRYMVSFLVIAVIILLRCLIAYGLFYFLSFSDTTTLNELLIIAGASSIVIKIMSFTYEFIVYRITIWENHEKKSKLYNSQAFKLIFFEFFNNYSGMFYIAFYKPYHQIKCYTNNCLKELEYHLYTLVLINFVLNYLFELSWYGLKKIFRMKKYHIDSRLSSQSLVHQMSCDRKNNLLKEYNQKLIDFGYICLFSVSAPLAPLIILVLTYFQNLFDIYKIFNLYRIEMIDGSSGIEIYYSKFKVFNYLGMISNICLVLFTSPKLVHLDEYLKNKITNNEDFIIKIIIFAIIENVMLLFMKVVKYRNDMVWFQHVEDLKILYDKKYFSRNLNTLPHISMEHRYMKEE